MPLESLAVEKLPHLFFAIGELYRIPASFADDGVLIGYLPEREANLTVAIRAGHAYSAIGKRSSDGSHYRITIKFKGRVSHTGTPFRCDSMVL
jgi:hypothetical protein